LGNTHKILGTENTKRLIVDVLIANRDFVKRSPQAISSLIANYFRTLKYFRDTPSALTEEVKSAARVDEKQIEVMLKGVRWATLTDNAREWFGIGTAGPGGEGLVDAIESAAQILVDAGDVKESPVPERDPYRLQYRMFVEELFTSGLDSPFETTDATTPEGATKVFTALSDAQWDTLRDVGTLKIRSIPFQSGTSDLNLEGKQQLDAAADNLSHYPHFRVVIRGHTGTRGDRASNKELSLARADAVRRYLMITHGIEEARLHTIGYGGERPLPRSADESDRAYEYRLPRVELSLVSEAY
jgi:outer membrane protein OmpA-like peptidoglycan-associated protein